jgi:acetyl-CoA hydrolase
MTVETALDDIHFPKLVKPGESIIWTQGAGEPTVLLERLFSQRGEIGHFSAFLGASYSRLITPDLADAISFTGLGGVGSNGVMTRSRAMGVIPCHLSELPRYFSTRMIPIDVAIVQLSPENADGSFSLSTTCGYIPSAIENARLVIGEVNDQAPWTASRIPFKSDRLDIIVRVSRPLVTSAARGFTEIDEAIAGRIAQWIPDGAVLQLGVGALPNAITAALSGHRNLGLHSGTLGDCMMDLLASGAVTNASKTTDKGSTIVGTLVGSPKLYDFVHNNPRILVEPVTYTHDLKVISGHECFVAVNSAIEVDVTGQINAEAIGADYVGTIGGQVDFIRGALASPKGRSIIALPSLAGKARTSRIVTQLNGSVVTTARADADIVVTEHGSAELRGVPIKERIRRMIAIADPTKRETLARDAHSLIAGQ